MKGMLSFLSLVIGTIAILMLLSHWLLILINKII